MKSFNTFVAEAARANLQLDVSPRVDAASIDADAMFHTPLLALTILIIARARRELETYEASVWTGATLSAHFTGLHEVDRRLEWSLQLRRRCADALVFLENVGLVSIELGERHVVRVSTAGQGFLRRLFEKADDEGLLARGLSRAHATVQSTGLTLL